jgi:Bor protein
MKRRAAGRIALLLTLVLSAGCWYHRIEVTTPASAGTEYESTVAWSLLWGAVQGKEVTPDNCNGQGLKEVKVSSNLGFALLTVVTLGLVAPERIQWRCASPVQTHEGGVPPDGQS